MQGDRAFPPLVSLAVKGIEALIESMGKLLLGSIYDVVGLVLFVALAGGALYFLIKFLRWCWSH